MFIDNGRIKAEHSQTKPESEAKVLLNDSFLEHVMKLPVVVACVLCWSLLGCAVQPVSSPQVYAKEQVIATERAFAMTMANRDQQAFGQFISTEAIFYSGPTPLRGKQKIVDAWAKFFSNSVAPFSWEPQDVEVLESGQLAISSGPVRDAEGKLIATFTSIWRLESTNTWRIVFDKGNGACNCSNP